MTDDIVERLRDWHVIATGSLDRGSIYRDAADEIERLRGLIDALADAYNAMEPLRQDPDAEVWPLMNVWRVALEALLAAATPKENDRGNA